MFLSRCIWCRCYCPFSRSHVILFFMFLLHALQNLKPWHTPLLPIPPPPTRRSSLVWHCLAMLAVCFVLDSNNTKTRRLHQWLPFERYFILSKWKHPFYIAFSQHREPPWSGCPFGGGVPCNGNWFVLCLPCECIIRLVTAEAQKRNWQQFGLVLGQPLQQQMEHMDNESLRLTYQWGMFKTYVLCFAFFFVTANQESLRFQQICQEQMAITQYYINNVCCFLLQPLVFILFGFQSCAAFSLWVFICVSFLCLRSFHAMCFSDCVVVCFQVLSAFFHRASGAEGIREGRDAAAPIFDLMFWTDHRHNNNSLLLCNILFTLFQHADPHSSSLALCAVIAMALFSVGVMCCHWLQLLTIPINDQSCHFMCAFVFIYLLRLMLQTNPISAFFFMDVPSC